MAADNDNYSIFALPADDLVLMGDAVLSMSTPNTLFPATNAADGNPRTLAKSLGLSTTVTATIAAGNRTVVGVVVFNTNATIITFESDAGAISSVTVLARDTEGQLRDPWKDTTGLANITDDVFRILLSKGGSTPLQFGEVALLTAWRPMNLVKGLQFGFRRPGNERLETRLGAEHVWVSSIRQREAEGTIKIASDLGLHMTLNAQSAGADRPFVFIPYRLGAPLDQGILDGAWLVKYIEDKYRFAAQDHMATDIKIILREMAKTAPPPTT